MKNLVFRFWLVVTLCWGTGLAERSANGYFYDKPEGTLFDESPGLSQVSNAVPVYPPVQVQPAGGYFPQLLQPRPSVAQQAYTTVEVVPAKLIYEDVQDIPPTLTFGLQQQGLQNVQNFVQQPQKVYGVPAGGNLQPVAFSLQDSNVAYNSVQQPCGPEPIVAQFNPELVDLSRGGPLTRVITTCGPNNDCSNINLQADLNRQLGALAPRRRTDTDQAEIKAEPRNLNVGIFAEESPLVRPPGRRLIQYSEIERDDPYN